MSGSSVDNRRAYLHTPAWIEAHPYVFAILVVALCLGLRFAIDPWLGDQMPYITFLLAVAVAGLFAGVGPASVAAGLGAAVAYWCFVPPRYQWGFAAISDAVGFGAFVVGAAAIILLIHLRTRAAKAAQESLSDQIETERQLHDAQALSQEVLRKSERLAASAQMASLLAHEINNPLAAITNLLYLLGKEPLAPKARDYVVTATAELQRITHIAALTMAFFREEEMATAVEVCRVLDEISRDLLSAPAFSNVHLIKEFKVQASVIAIESKVRQLLNNLLVNAFESGAQRVRIRVTTRHDWRNPARSGVAITIADDGPGVSREDRQHLFEPFFSTKPEKGRGLGLWSSKAMVLRNDGGIRLRSRNEKGHSGTCIVVFLPLAMEKRAASVSQGRAARTA